MSGWKKLFGWDEKPLQRHYVSELDRFLQDFDKNYKKKAYSESRYAEEAKYARISKLRDDPALIIREKDVFEDF